MIFLYALIFFIITTLVIRLGLLLPDIDLAPPIPLKHRSAWSHGPFIAILVDFIPDTDNGNIMIIVLKSSFLLGIALHLSYDLFPKKWGGVANISLYPIPVRLPGSISFLFLFGSMAYSLSTASKLLTLPVFLIVLLIAIIASYKYVKSQQASFPIVGQWLPTWFSKRAGDILPIATTAITSTFIFMIRGVI